MTDVSKIHEAHMARINDVGQALAEMQDKAAEAFATYNAKCEKIKDALAEVVVLQKHANEELAGVIFSGEERLAGMLDAISGLNLAVKK